MALLNTLCRFAGCLTLSLLLIHSVWAGPWMEPGDSALRHDIQVLSDAGVIRAPITTWPLSWGDIAASLQEPNEVLPAYQEAALARLRRRAAVATATGTAQFRVRASATENPRQIRSFEDGPREDSEIEAAASWTGDRFALRLSGQYVNNPDDGKEWRADGSYVGMALGNWMLAGSLVDRWWGPAWSGSLILSSNARPIPAFTLDRNFTTAPQSKWLRWIGPWDLAVMVGQLEGDRDVSNPNFFGFRFTFKPTPQLEIGLSRTALWCGDGRSCNLQDFFFMLIGKDNRGQNVSPEDEPGDQLFDFDLRWSGTLGSQPYALYTQWTAEDLGKIKPSKFLGLFGAETWGEIDRLGSVRMYFEYADTQCDFEPWRNSEANCAYNHSIFTTGYRYRGRSIGSSLDNDAAVFTLGGMLTDHQDNSWLLTINLGNLNRTGPPDVRNTVAEVKTRYREIELTHRRALPIGSVDLGLGYDYRKNMETGKTNGDPRLFLRWQYGY